MAARYIAMLCLIWAALAAPLGAFAAASQDKPLMVIRFNQQRVYFLNSLDLAVIKARQAKPDVQFSVVSYVLASNKEADANLVAVVQEMRRLGVPTSQIAVGVRADASLDSKQEIHIFVE